MGLQLSIDNQDMTSKFPNYTDFIRIFLLCHRFLHCLIRGGIHRVVPISLDRMITYLTKECVGHSVMISRMCHSSMAVILS